MELLNFEKDIILENARVLLRPLSMDDKEALSAFAYDRDTWKFTLTHVYNEHELDEYIRTFLADRAKHTRYPFTIIDKQSGKVAGSTSYLNISQYDLRLEIGSTWIGKEFRRSGLNRYCKHALLSYAFETLGLERVELKTHSLNILSRTAIKGIGAIEEGTLRNHSLMMNGRRRDTVYFSILRNEWPTPQLKDLK
jgi:N-acetyltransferase